MKVVVTGASGCLGSAVLAKLGALGMDVVAVSRRAVAGATRAVLVDLTDPSFPTKLPAQYDAVLHLAQSRQYRNLPDSAADVYLINTMATLRLAESARKAGAKCFIYASTGSVYLPLERAVDENAATAPKDLYVASKLAGEMLLNCFAPYMSILCVRLFYLYGPGQFGTMIVNIARRVRTGVPVDLYGEEGISVAPVFSVDVARILFAALRGGWSGVVNVGAPERCSLKHLALSIGECVGRTPLFRLLPKRDDRVLLPDVHRLQSALGCFEFTPLMEGLRLTFNDGTQK